MTASTSLQAELTSPIQKYVYNKEGRLVPNGRLHATSPVWISSDIDQVLGIIHISRLSQKETESLADTSAAPELETQISAQPRKDTDGEEWATRSIQDLSNLSRNRERRISSDPPSNVSKLKDLPPSARQSLPPRVRREYRQQMIQMDVENNNNAVILGSTDKAHGNMELEWGNAI
jgi:hypothetical protein